MRSSNSRKLEHWRIWQIWLRTTAFLPSATFHACFSNRDASPTSRGGHRAIEKGTGLPPVDQGGRLPAWFDKRKWNHSLFFT